MVLWVSEFAEYNLDIRYRKEKDAIVPDAQSRRPNFISNGPTNQAEKLWLSFWKIDKYEWYDAMVVHLNDGTMPKNDKIRKLIQNGKDGFKMGKDPTTDKPWLYRKMRDNKAPWLEPEFRSDFVERMHTE